MDKSVFISRNLRDDSPMQKLQEHGYQIHGESLIEISPVSFDLRHGGKWIFFYSQHGVEAYLKTADIEPKNAHLVAAFGPKTALGLQKRNIPVAFIGNGHAAPTARAFSKLAAGEAVVFARAKQSMRSVQKALGDVIEAIDLVVYNNVGKTEPKIPAARVLVFTSPLNVRTYLDHHNISTSQLVIAIGPSTARTLHERGHREVIIPDRPAEEEIVKLILTRSNEIA